MRTSTPHAEHVVLPTALVPSLLADAASLLSESATSTVQNAMASYQQAMLLLVRWYEAGQLEGLPTPPPRPVTVRHSTQLEPAAPAPAAPKNTAGSMPSENSGTSASTAEALLVPESVEPRLTVAHSPPTATLAALDVAAPTTEIEPSSATRSLHADPSQASPSAAVAAPSSGAARAILPGSAPPLAGAPPCDALGQAARLAISRRYGVDGPDDSA